MMNIVLVILDTLRKDHVGAYGNQWIYTPHLDQLAKESVRFSHYYPESLPTLPFRRAIHTGLRTFPYHGHKPYKGDFSGAPGWGPIPEEQTTIAELLVEHGYRTALITDNYHQFKPSKNFHRGFEEWIWIRGQEGDKYKSGPKVSENLIRQHMVVPPAEDPALASFLERYLRNNAFRRNELDYFAPRVFAEAARWIWDNQDAEKFFLVIDSFDPHEPWDPPSYYRKLYDADDDTPDVIQSLYAPYKGVLNERQLRRLQANYAGEVTMVDRWFGYFYETLKLSGRLKDTLVIVTSDHGHNLGYPGDQGLVSKQGHPLTPAVADLVLFIRHPEGIGAGKTYDKLIYNVDVTATLLALAGVEVSHKLDGFNFWPEVSGTGSVPERNHVTIGWGPLVTVITKEWWYNATIWGEDALLFRITEDPRLERNLAAQYPEVAESLRLLAVEDAGGEIPEAFKEYSRLPGCSPYNQLDDRFSRWVKGV